MLTVLATLAVFLLMVLIMAVGVMVHGRHLKGSCGGVGGNCHCKATEAGSCEVRKNGEQPAA
jgi:hypothetical protein